MSGVRQANPCGVPGAPPHSAAMGLVASSGPDHLVGLDGPSLFGVVVHRHSRPLTTGCSRPATPASSMGLPIERLLPRAAGN